MSDDRLEQILNEMKAESVPAEELAGAKDRVWQKLTAAVATACGEFRPEIAPYVAGGLSEQRRLLLEDHLSRCAECRRVYAEAKGERKVVTMPTSRRPLMGRQWTRWAVAAGLAVVGLYLGRERLDTALAPGGARALVQSVSGKLYRATAAAIDAGGTLADSEVVRTGPNTRAVLRLTDGSLVEVNERTELSVRAAWSGESIYLERGDVIVQAAKQRRGHLRVITRDSIVSVKGTVFAVSSGSAGSLVSVVEGSVEVAQAGGEQLLKPGQQAASNQALATVPVKEALAWSQDAEKYFAVLAELVQIEKQLTAPAPRTQARLLAYLPAAPIAYGAIPNLGGTIQQAMTLIEQRAGENAALRDWWGSESGQKLKKLLDSVQTVTPLLGDEIVFVMSKDAAANGQIPLMLAEVKAGQQDALKQAIDKLAAGAVYQIAQNLLVVSDTQAHLAAMMAQLGRGAGSPFAAEIAQRYQRGTGWLFGADLTAMDWKAPEGDVAEAVGLTQVKHVFFEQRTAQGGDDNSAVVTFRGARTGMASWLAAPAAAGSAEYASSEAVLVLSASTKNPRQAFDEMLALMSKNSVKAVDGLREFEVKTGVSVGNEIAASLGTDFTVVVEKPTIPIPEWVAAIEVEQPALLEGAVKKMVDAFNAELKPEQKQNALMLTQETVNGRTYTSVRSGASPMSVCWTYDRNYLVLSTDRASVAKAIATREGGFALVRSDKFRQQAPGAGTVHYSGFFWLNTHGVLSSFSGLVDSPSLKTLMENQEPVLVVLNGETERIQASSRTRLTSLVLDMMLAGGPGHVKNAARM